MRDFILNKAIFEIRLKKGYLYWDKCGDTLLKIEKEDPDWKWQDISLKGANLINEKRDFKALFSWHHFWIEQEHVENINQFKIAADKLYKIISTNLEVNEISRIGNRYWFILPCNSPKDAENVIRKSEIITPNTKKLGHIGKNITNIDFTLVLEEDDIKYRIAVGAAKREKNKHLDGNEKFLKFNPHNGVLFDIDVFTFPNRIIENFEPSQFIHKAHKKIVSNINTLFK